MWSIKKLLIRLVLAIPVFFVLMVLTSGIAGATTFYTWDDEESTVTITSDTPTTITWATVRSKDRAATKSVLLMPRYNEDGDYDNSVWYDITLGATSLAIPVRPSDSIALKLKISVRNLTEAGVLTLKGKDREGSSLTEGIDIDADGDYQTVNSFRSIDKNGISGTGSYEIQIWQDRWGILGRHPDATTSYTLQGGIIVDNNITFVPATTLTESYQLSILGGVEYSIQIMEN